MPSVFGTSHSRMILRAATAGLLPVLLAGCPPGGGRTETASVESPPPATVISHDTSRAIRLKPDVLAFCQRMRWRTCQVWQVIDRQRLNDGSDGFGPIATIIPAENLGRLTQAQFEGQSGALVAMINVDTTANSVPASYKSLELVAGNNCVYLRLRANVWEGFVVPADPSSANGCASMPASPTLQARQEISVVAGATDSVPPVARWHQGTVPPNRGQPFFGVKCLTGWCMVFPSSTTVPRNATTDAGFPDSRASRVRGWYDHQNVALKVGNALRYDPRFAATVVPVADLGDLTDAAFNDRWVTVANVRFSSSPRGTQYERKWGFQPGMNVVQLRYNTNTSKWEARSATTAGRRLKELSVWADPHPGYMVPGTARWRWEDHDEELWVRCLQGCCYVSGT